MQTPARAGCDFLRRRWYRGFAPKVDPPCLRPAQFERLGRAGSVPTTGSCRTGQSLGSLARLEDFAGSSDMDDLLVVWLSPPAMESPPECQDDPPAHNQDDWSTTLRDAVKRQAIRRLTT